MPRENDCRKFVGVPAELFADELLELPEELLPEELLPEVELPEELPPGTFLAEAANPPPPHAIVELRAPTRTKTYKCINFKKVTCVFRNWPEVFLSSPVTTGSIGAVSERCRQRRSLRDVTPVTCRSYLLLGLSLLVTKWSNPIHCQVADECRRPGSNSQSVNSPKSRGINKGW